MDRKPKTVLQLDSPFTAVQWPQISSPNQETIVEVLCSLLCPVGQYRSNHITSSKGKRSKKRKRHEAKAKAEDAATIAIPPPPEISSFLAVGLNSITRSLESLSEKSRPPQIQAIEGTGDSELPNTVGESKEPNFANKGSNDGAKHLLEGHFSAIFICRSTQSTILYEHLPQLVFTASLAHPELPATRLVELPNSSEVRLCEALGIPRVSFIGILEGAPHSKPLVDLVRECVPEIEIPWMQQVKESKYLPVKINAIETFSTVAKKGQA